MRKFSVSEIEKIPEDAGVFCFLSSNGSPRVSKGGLHRLDCSALADARASAGKNKTVFVGVAENLKQEISRVLSDKDFLRKETEQIETTVADEKNLIRIFAEIIRARKPKFNFDLSGQRHFAHFKITNEKFPRLLVTRKIETDGSAYFGAFLPETGARLLLDFLNRTFRLRSCTIKIDGDFNVPCTQHYEKRCVAPCVESLCDKAEYDEAVELLKLFLAGEREELEKSLSEKVEFAAANLDFETAGEWRDFLREIQNVWNKKDFQLWTNDAVDSFETEEQDEKIFVRLVSQRGRKVLGKRVFVFERIENFDAADVLSQIAWQLYEFYAPKEIRFSADSPNRKFLSKVLSVRENRKIKTSVVGNQKITTERAFGRARFEFDFRHIKPVKNFGEIQNEIAEEFVLKIKPEKIEAFDAAHISGTDSVAAKTVWRDGKFLIDEYEFWFSDAASEPETLEKAIRKRVERKNDLPDLILIDGGKSQLNAALKAVENLKNRKFSIVAAVKPPQKHSEVSHFIKENGEVVKMRAESETFQLLVRLRDEAHDLANGVHRQRRDNSHFYELAALLPSVDEKERRFLLRKYGSLKQLKSLEKDDLIKIVGAEKAEMIFTDLRKQNEKIEPLIVPIRFDDKNGDARDLQPISKQEGEKEKWYTRQDSNL